MIFNSLMRQKGIMTALKDKMTLALGHINIMIEYREALKAPFGFLIDSTLERNNNDGNELIAVRQANIVLLFPISQELN